MTKLEEVARAIYESIDQVDVFLGAFKYGEEITVDGRVDFARLARAAVEALRDPDDDALMAMYEAMFEDRYDGTQAPLVGAGFEAGLAAILSDPAGEWK